MSHINFYANVLREFVYNPEVQLINQSSGKIPCFYCVYNVYRDLSLRYCAGLSPESLLTFRRFLGGVKLTPEEVSAWVASAMPLYACNVSAATCLHSAILCLDTCEDVPVEGEGTYDELPSAFEAKPALRALLDEYLDNPVPDVPVAFAGVAPVSHPGQATPARRRGAAEPPRTPE
ncbi:uncharacterized protein FFB20_04831 [Fusarium fujikuroi]|nr:uncharacterized protein FFB20_04831 [Fusarium fujikuroi]